jgi:type I restriction enzyme M protein
MLSHLDEGGLAGTVMSNGALDVQGTEGEIRQSIIESDLVDTVIALPNRLFYTTEIPVCIWILSKGKGEYTPEHRERKQETLFVDAREMFKKVDRTHKTLTREHIKEIAETVRAYRGEPDADEYENEEGFCKVADIEGIRENDYIIAPGRYVGIAEDLMESDVPFETRMEVLSSELKEKFEESEELRNTIEKNLEEVGF